MRDLEVDSCDPSKLFSHIGKFSGTATEPTSVLNMNSLPFEGVEVVEAWAGYFHELASPRDNGYHLLFAQEISSQFGKILNL